MSKALKGDPFSIRLSRPTDRFVAHEAHRTGRSKSAIVEALTEEAARMRRFPGIAFRGPDGRRRAWVIGSGLDVWQIVEAWRDLERSLDRLLAETEVSERAARLALAYAAEFADEVDELIADNRPPLDEFQALYPFVEIVELNSR